MKFCPQCGTSLVGGDSFCQQCGFKLDHEISVSPGVQPTVPYSTGQEIPLPPPTFNQNQQSGPGVYTPPQTGGYPSSTKKKSKLVPILLVLGALILLGGGGWLVYSNFFKAKAETVLTDNSNIMPPETTTTVADSTPTVAGQPTTQVPATTVEKVTKQETPAQPAKVPATVAPPVKTKTEAKTEVKPAATVSQPVKVNEPVKETKSVAASQPEPKSQPVVTNKVVPPSKTIFQIGQLGLSILRNPKKDCDFTLKDRYCITRITTDHFNNGKGTASPGTIGIGGINGGQVKTWNAKGGDGPTGIANCKWFIEPGIILEAGNYTVIDSDRETWAKNIAGKGFVIIEGYLIQ